MDADRLIDSHEISESFEDNTRDDQSKIITSKDVTVKHSKNPNCFVNMITCFNRFIWQNEASLLKTDHLKAAPCITTKQLAFIRLLFALILII